MLLKKGSKGENVKKLQQFLNLTADGDFGSGTESAVKAWQQKNGLKVDGLVGTNTLGKMGIKMVDEPAPEFDKKYHNVTIAGSHFPDAPIKMDQRISLKQEMEEEYLPALDRALKSSPKGLKLLCTIMAHKEGFFKGSRSYRTNNPGNIGNTDSGSNQTTPTLEAGILKQKEYIEKIARGDHSAYPMAREKVLKPYYSPEIAKHAKSYGMSPYVPGYRFVFTGQLDQFVKIYSTGARGGNGYLSMIISYFNQHGIEISPESKVQDIIKMG